ncbi:MAG: hypothetical protein PHO07_00825 [Pirellulales bacterium]|jgi:hypothetical protein|nr:hypothetical protein [Thermoguttaceae bacterium]MDD4785687.1 hypothetical protein [Pirellulales bacterium]MDI9446384.1 hypothetical protein [Planctomycetota bacterium]NLZ01121.1 hypothetical protein [Pirellulaceae bacterium]
MKTSLFLSSVLAWVGAAVCQAAESSPPAPSGVTASYVSIETPAGGRPMLVIRYPWRVHARSSVEVCTYVAGEADDSPRIRPLYFRSDFMKDEFTIGVYRAQDDSSSVRVVAQMARRDIDFAAIGNRNLFGQPSVVVVCRTSITQQKDEQEPEQARRAIYPLLEPWAADRRTLFLSLPEVNFSDAAKIRVWFLSGGDVVWSEVKQWPGLPQDESK